MEIRNILTIYDFPVQEPCWYATSEKVGTIKEYKWRVGCVYPDHKDEVVLAFNEFGDLKNKDTYKDIIGARFAIRLIALFRKGGEREIRNWMKGERYEMSNG